MKFRIIYFFLFFFLFSCVEDVKLISKDKVDLKKPFTSQGFTLVYNNDLLEEKIIKKKMDNREFVILHSFLKPKTFVKIYNPINLKTVIAKVKYNTNYPVFYNSVITKRIAEELELNYEEPYVEIIEIKQNDTFIAKKAKTFDEEKNVANKAPVVDININIISDGSEKTKTEKTKTEIKKNEYIILIGEFYYLETAKIVKNRLINEANLSNIKIEKISEKNFRVYAGTYTLFNTMKDTYFIISKLGFEHLDIKKIN